VSKWQGPWRCEKCGAITGKDWAGMGDMRMLVQELRDSLQGMCDAEDLKDYLVLAGALEWAHITIARADAALAGEPGEGGKL